MNDFTGAIVALLVLLAAVTWAVVCNWLDRRQKRREATGWRGLP
jgi:peptidoglycan/LPS O-acetylase OafA/YrhL